MTDEQQQDAQQHTEQDTSETSVDETVKEVEVNVDFKDKYLRAHADYQNLVRETNTRRAEWAQMSEVQVLEAFIPVFDNFKKAAAHQPTEDSSAWKNWGMGIGFIQKQFADVLKQFGVEEMQTIGQMFDPTRHEAVEEEVNEDVEMNTVLREIEQGYIKNGKVIKPAKVVVSKKDTSE
jgi:molecular chaperone GrpE